MYLINSNTHFFFTALSLMQSHPVPASSVAGGGAPMSAMSGLDDFEDELVPQEQDFALLIRSKLVTEHNHKNTISGFEVLGISYIQRYLLVVAGINLVILSINCVLNFAEI